MASHHWMIAFGFGLIHGFGFASVLTDLGLPQDSLLPSLVSFNIGVALDQLAIVAAFLPLAYLLHHSWSYPKIDPHRRIAGGDCHRARLVYRACLDLHLFPL
jgi:hypothetical protein